MTIGKERIAKTEALFRNVNEGIAEASERLESDEGHFICECGDPSCTKRIELPINEYHRVRDDATKFVVEPGHEKDDLEQVVARRRGYSVIRKVDRVMTAIVRRLNPRPKTASMIDAMRSSVSGRELAALGHADGTAAMLAHRWRPGGGKRQRRPAPPVSGGRERPRHARSRSRAREIVASII